MSERWRISHIPALDGLRGAAVAAVLLYHAGYLDGGYLGVDLFFVLSGFLITSLLLAEHEGSGRIGLGHFWVRRARRLLPALFVVLAAVALYAWLLARRVDLTTIREDGLATLFYVANWHTILRGDSYWDLSLAPSPLGHTWSLAIEEQFYLFWPLIVLAVARLRIGGRDLAAKLGPLAIAGAAASALLFVGLRYYGSSETRVYEGTDTRAVALLLGVAVAAYRQRIDARMPARLREGTGVAAAVLLIGTWVWLDGQSSLLYRGALPATSLLAAVVIAAACSPRSTIVARACSVAPLRGLGLISYGLYLWHWPVFVALELRNTNYPGLGNLELSGAAMLVAKLALSLGFAIASYRLVEQPIRRGALRGWTAGLSTAGAIGAVAAVLVVATAGAIDVEDDDIGTSQAAGRIEDAPYVLFVGDSVARSLARPLVEHPEDFGINVINSTRLGCSLFTESYEIRSFLGEVVDPVPCADDPHPDGYPSPSAVFVYLGARPNDSIRIDGEWVRACDPRFDEAYEIALRELLASLMRDGIPSVVATIPPSGRFAIPVEGADERIACANTVVADVVDSTPSAHLLAMEDLLCPDGDCREEIDGAPLRSDGVHYDDGPGGALVTEWVVAHVAEATGVERQLERD